MNGRICLLTFNTLPNRQLEGEDSPFTTAYERLDATSTFFEQHYLQQTDFSAILGHSGVIAELSKIITEERISAIAVRIGADEIAFGQSDRMPNIFRQHTIATVSKLDALCSENEQILWVHTSLAAKKPKLEQVAAFEQCIAQCRQLTSESDSVLLVTSINGIEAPDTPFESLLFESQIKVPLWVEQPSQQSARVQCTSGSFDVLKTISEILKSSGDHEQIDQNDRASHDRPLSLIELLDQSGNLPERTLKMQNGHARAIRNNNFLYCHVEDNTDGRANEVVQAALYSKPEDIWNIHDVSAEYLELTQDFQDRISAPN